MRIILACIMFISIITFDAYAGKNNSKPAFFMNASDLIKIVCWRWTIDINPFICEETLHACMLETAEQRNLQIPVNGVYDQNTVAFVHCWESLSR